MLPIITTFAWVPPFARGFVRPGAGLNEGDWGETMTHIDEFMIPILAGTEEAYRLFAEKAVPIPRITALPAWSRAGLTISARQGHRFRPRGPGQGRRDLALSWIDGPARQGATWA